MLLLEAGARYDTSRAYNSIMHRRIIIALCLLGVLGLSDVWVDKTNPIDRFTSRYYGYASASSVVVPIGATVLLCVVVGILTMPTPRRASLRAMGRYGLVIVLTVGAAESLVLGSISYHSRMIDVFPEKHPRLRTGAPTVVLTFDSGDLECHCTFCAESDIAKSKFLIRPKRWCGFRLRYNCTPDTGSRFWRCPAGQASFSAHLALPFWFLFALLSPYPAFAFVRWLRRYRRGKRGRCLECGYSLTGNVSGICPECGSAVTLPANVQD